MRAKIFIEGIVQGVGFRPFVYKLAKEFNLNGYVLNTGSGVIIEAEGENLNEFIESIKTRKPPLSKIEKIDIKFLENAGFNSFEIKFSQNSSKTTFISPDISVCEDCLKEMYDKNNRRYLYPFINCTNCGPRYTIIENIPYDRKNTSMKKFKMCKKCEAEYISPMDRRYHAQPISCYECGPKLNVKCKMKNNKWEEIKFKEEIEKIKFIAKKIKEGKIVAIKGLGGFHLVCDASLEESVNELRRRKRRQYKPFAMMFKNIEMIKKYAKFGEKEKELILSNNRPIVIVEKLKELKGIAPDINRYGVFLPYTPVHYLLFDFLDNPIVATSANISNEPIITNSGELIKKLGNVVDFILDYDRDIINACDDSVTETFDNKTITMRLARGFAPFSIKTDTSKQKILALGANQKSTITLAFEDNLILSPHIGDLNTVDSTKYFERTINTFKRLYNFDEDIIICDKHPYYESVKWAKKQNKKMIQVQHHFAHILSVMLEYNLKGNFLAFAFDGTGLGDDGSIWGGEVFTVNRHTYERRRHIKYFKLIGVENAIKNPANMAVGLIDDKIAQNYKNYKLAKTLKNADFPLTSSAGRVFDMTAFLGGFCERNEYEGFSGLLIEKYYNENIKKYIDLGTDEEIDIVPLLNFAAKNRGNLELISSVFLNSLANLIEKTAKNYDLPVILTGGVFQNKTLMKLVFKKLKNVYFNSKIPINDGGISVGQAAYGIWNL